MPTENENSSWNLRGPELLVECYLRLNGYFIVNNFILHDQHGSQKTEVDLIGVRFPNQIEIIKDDGGRGQNQKLENDPKLIGKESIIDIIIAEVKKGEARINRPFGKEEVLEYILNWIGCLNEKEKIKAIKCLKKKEDFYTGNGRIRVRFVCFGEQSKIECKQITLLDALRFIRGRFRKYFDYKTDSKQWNGVMKYVYTVAYNNSISDDSLLEKILDGKWNLALK